MDDAVFLTAAILAAGAVPAVRRLAIRAGAVDQPNADVRTHDRPTPLLGGMAILLGTWTALYLWTTSVALPREVGAYLLLLGLGAYKDISRRDVAPAWQLVAQAVACWMIAGGGASFQADPWLRAIWTLAGVVWMNSINFLDVMDGLCALVSLIIGLAHYATGHGVLPLALVGSCSGFWLWNRPKAAIFMGDIGSFFIGATLFQVLTSAIAIERFGVLLAHAVPVGEFAGTLIIRRWRSRALTMGDASHPSLCLLNRGWSPWSVLGLYGTLTLLTCVAAGWIVRG